MLQLEAARATAEQAQQQAAVADEAAAKLLVERDTLSSTRQSLTAELQARQHLRHCLSHIVDLSMRLEPQSLFDPRPAFVAVVELHLWQQV